MRWKDIGHRGDDVNSNRMVDCHIILVYIQSKYPFNSIHIPISRATNSIRVSTANIENKKLHKVSHTHRQTQRTIDIVDKETSSLPPVAMPTILSMQTLHLINN